MFIKSISFYKNSYEIEFSNFEKVNIIEDTLVKFNLYKNLEVADDFPQKLREENNFIKAFNLACSYLKNIKATKDVKDYLRKKEIPDEIIEEIIFGLEYKGFLDDLNYSKLYIRDSQKLNKYGQNKIKYNLISKGIDKYTVEDALESLDYDLERENIRNLFTRKIKDDYSTENINKAVKYLINKGYAYEMIKDFLYEVRQEYE